MENLRKNFETTSKLYFLEQYRNPNCFNLVPENIAEEEYIREKLRANELPFLFAEGQFFILPEYEEAIKKLFNFDISREH